MDNNQMNFDPQTGKPINPQISNEPVKTKKKMNPFIIVLIVIGSIALLFVGLFLFVIGTSKKLECTSNEGDITIMYNSKSITGYTSKNIRYDFDGQSKIADEIGIESYITEFEEWFESNTTGTCKRK